MSISRHRRSRRRFPIGVDHPWWRRSHEFSFDFTLIGPIFLLVPGYFARITTNSSLHSTCTKPPLLSRLVVLVLTSVGSLLRVRKPRHQQCRTLIGSNTVTSHGTVWLVMHALRWFLLRIFVQAEKQEWKWTQRRSESLIKNQPN